MRNKRKRVARKNSDSGVSVDSSVGLNTSENSSDKDASCTKVTPDQLNWNLVPVVRLHEVSLVKDDEAEYGVNISNMNPESVVDDELFDFHNITITTSQKGRTVNGQPLVVPSNERDVCIVLSSENEDDGEEYSAAHIDKKFSFVWNRGSVDYDVLVITSHSEVFKGAVLMDFNDLGECWSGSERSGSRCSTLSEDYKTASPVFPLRKVFVEQKNIAVSESRIVSPDLASRTLFLEPRSVSACEENRIDTPLLPRRTFVTGQKRAASSLESTPLPVKDCSGSTEEPSRTPSQDRLKRIRLDASVRFNGTNTKTQSANTPQASDITNSRQDTHPTAVPQLRRQEKSPVRVLDSTVVRLPDARLPPPTTFKIPRQKGTKHVPTHSYYMSSPQNNQVEDDGLSICCSSELETEIESHLHSSPLPEKSSRRQLPLPNTRPPRKHSPIQINNHWSPPPPIVLPERDRIDLRERDYSHPFGNGQNVPVNNAVPQTPPPPIPRDFNCRQPPPLMNFDQFIGSRYSIPPRLVHHPNFDYFNSSNHLTPPPPPPFRHPNFNSPNENFNSNPETIVDQNETRVVNNNFSTLKKMTYQLCRQMKICTGQRCKYLHEIPTDFRQVLLLSEENCVNEIAIYILKKCSPYVVNHIIPMVITYYTINRRLNLVLNLMPVLFQNKYLNRPACMQQIINALISTSEGSNFKDAINEIILYNGIKASDTLDVLFEVIPLQEDFLMTYWDEIWKLIKYRKTPVPFQIIDDFIKECNSQDHYDADDKVECWSNMCKFLMNCTFDIKHINERQMQTFLKKLKDVNLDNYVASIKDMYTKAGCPLSDQSFACDDSLLEFTCELPSEKSSALHTFILDRNINEITCIIREYSHVPSALFNVFALVHNRKVMTISEFVALFQDLVENLDYRSAEGNLKVTIETIGFNLIPLCDFEKDYTSACIILNIFISNIKSFLSVKNYITQKPYMDNLKNDPERIVLFIKIFTRASSLNNAFLLIKMPEFELFNKKTVRSLYNYKMNVIDECIGRAVATDLKLSWRIMEYLLKNEIEAAKCHIPDHYSSYLKVHLQSVDAEAVATEYYASIKFYYKHINDDVLRAIVANLSTVLKPIDLEMIYDYCCSKSIYIQHTGSENTITLRQNLTIPEIKMVFKMFFLKMLGLNRAVSEVKIHLYEVSDIKGVNTQLGIFKQPEKCDKLAMMMRLSSALFTFEPMIKLDDHPEKLPSDVVMRCLEHIRRNL